MGIDSIIELFNLTPSTVINRLFFFIAVVAVVILLGVIVLIIINKIFNKKMEHKDLHHISSKK